MSMRALVNIVAYGVPALLIMLGFFAYLAGYSINALLNDGGLMNIGVALIAMGIIFYLIELAAKILAAYYG